jgi:ATP-binding cassette subfamily F protein 3
MSILTVSNLGKSFGTELLFEEVSFSMAAEQKMGLVGRNGSGKTTFLRILMRLEKQDSGKISLASGARLEYLRQEAPVHPEHTVWEEVQAVFAPIRAMESRIQELEHEMTAPHSDEAVHKIMADYSDLRDKFDAAGGYHYASDIELVMERLGFGPQDHDKLVGSCSGGEQTRLALAKVVLSKPDLLILDEPTNHLDINATEWLEGFLKSYEGAVLLVSHDRYFLDAVCDTIADLDNQRLTIYKGNYSHFWRQKQEQIARQDALYEQQQAEIDRLEDIVKRNLAANATQAKLRLKTQGRIDRIERVERVKSDTTTIRAQFDADSAGRIGREVIRMEELSKGYGERTLFSGLDALIERGDRVGLVGPNGSGKTTLVKIILGMEQPTSGLLYFGNNVRISYFSQHAADSLDTSKSVLDTIIDITTDMTSTQARNYLARFLFRGDDVFKTVNMLSGGEKNKLALACMIVEPCNLLILDEPTNHLDILSCESLSEMLSAYSGTLLLVSHDRYLLNTTTTKTLGLLGDGRSLMLEGNYAAWREESLKFSALKSDIPRKVVPPVPKPAPSVVRSTNPKAGMNFRELSKARTKAREAVERTERAVQTVENKVADIELRLATPSASVQDMVSLAAEHTRLQDDLTAAFVAWEKAVAEEELLAD